MSCITSIITITNKIFKGKICWKWFSVVFINNNNQNDDDEKKPLYFLVYFLKTNGLTDIIIKDNFINSFISFISNLDTKRTIFNTIH